MSERLAKIRRWLGLFMPASMTIRQRLRDYFHALTLLPRGPRYVDTDEARQPGAEVLTDVVVRRENRVVRFLSTDPVRFDQSYRDWIAPLKQLPADCTAEEFLQAVERLNNFRPEGSNLFPLATYLAHLPVNAGSAAEWAQQCRGSRQLSIDWALALIKQPANAGAAGDPAVLFIYGLNP